MNIKEAKREIEVATKAYFAKDDHGLYCIPFKMQRPIIMLGPPGVGKTAVVEQIAEEMGVNFVSYSITHHTRQSALGLPFIAREEFAGREYSISEYTMSEIVASVYRAREESGVSEGILFLDEVNCVSETLAPAMLQFLQYKTFGMHHLPEGWVIVTAGNPPEYNRAAREFDPAMLDRLMKIDVEPNLEVWQEYAAVCGMHPAVTTYLDAKPSNFYKVRASARGSKIVTSRGWEDLSRMLQALERLGETPSANLYGRYLQDSEIADDFGVYYELFCKYQGEYNVPQILSGEVSAGLASKAKAAAFDERIALVGMLLDGVKERVYGAVELAEAVDAAEGDLRRLKADLDNGGDPAARVASHIDQVRNASGVGERVAGRVGRKEVVKAERLRLLDAMRSQIADNAGGEAASASARAAIAAGKKVAAEKTEAATAGIDNAFEFLDEAFGGESQECLIFSTRLALDKVVVKHVCTHVSKRYMEHNKNLLFEERVMNLLAEIEGLEE